METLSFSFKMIGFHLILPQCLSCKQNQKIRGYRMPHVSILISHRVGKFSWNWLPFRDSPGLSVVGLVQWFQLSWVVESLLRTCLWLGGLIEWAWWSHTLWWIKTKHSWEEKPMKYLRCGRCHSSLREGFSRPSCSQGGTLPPGERGWEGIEVNSGPTIPWY